jgi:hypothetical protein
MTNDDFDGPSGSTTSPEAAPDAPAQVPAPAPARAVRVKKPVRARASASAAKPAGKKAATAGKALAGVKPKAAPALKSAARARTPSDVVRVKFGAHEVWMARAIAGALSSKDKRKLKALLKKAKKRAGKAD